MNSPLAFADLRILATSDVHMHLTSWDALHQRHEEGRGFDILVSALLRARSTAKGACILLDNGDSLQGTPVGTHCAAHPNKAGHPWPDILNALDYDAVGLGNHDFDFGVPFLERIVRYTNAPTLCASFSQGGVDGVAPSVILTRDVTLSDGKTRSIKIGVTSVLPPQTAIWNQRFLAGLIEFDDGVPAAQRAVVDLQENGADIVVMLCHSGLGTRQAADDENFGVSLAHEVEGVDALVLGHTHQRFPSVDGRTDLNGIPAVMSGYAAEALGQIDLSLGWTESGWHTAGHNAKLLTPRDGDVPAPSIGALTESAVKQTEAELDRTLANTNAGLHTYFGMLMSGPSDALVARTMMDVIKEQVAGSDLADLPLLASVAPVTMGGVSGPGNYVDIPPGPVQARHIAMLTPFSNAIWALVLTGAELIQWVERASVFFGPACGGNGRLVNPDVPSFNFDMLHGLKADIDPFRPAMFDASGQVINPNARRVRRLSYGDAPIDENAKFLVAMTSFRGAGGGNFPGITKHTQVVRTNHDLCEAVHRSVARGTISPDHCPTVWGFVTERPTRVFIETSPHAKAHLDEIAAFEPQLIKENEAGFLEVSVLI
ncbi:MAG: 5'-nucleotidase C-terminal domain-containing protein [Tateyamaria sp.]|uniref:5'-nucleotidase C-terminal domain-containing protein n=1 Tax=Tateyamaria sp. TaxID=1929288 RepID=UPI0032896537